MIDPGTAAIGGAVISGLFGASGQSSANKTNIRLAKENREFQERMSNTQHQRSAKDLEKAGLNRILSLGSPASSPAGSVAQVQSTTQAASNSAANLASVLANIRKTNAETDFIKNKTAVSDTAANIGSTVNKGVSSVTSLIPAFGKELGEKIYDIQQSVTDTGKKTLNSLKSTAKQAGDDIESFFDISGTKASSNDKHKNYRESLTPSQRKFLDELNKRRLKNIKVK